MQDQLSKREDYFKQENFRLTEKTEFRLMDNRKKYVSNLLNQKPKIYNLKKKKNLNIEIDNLDLPDDYKNFSIKNINEEEESKIIFQMLEQTTNQNFIKLGITSLRKYMCEEGRNDQERTINKKEIFDLLLGHFLHSKDFSIKHEIYWIFMNSICQNYHLRTILENDFNFLKKIEEDWEYENSFFITSITLLCSNFLKYSSDFCSNLLKINFFKKVLDYLLCSKREQIIDLQNIKDSMKLIHSILKFKPHSIDFPMETIEKLLDILNIYFEDFLSEKIFYNILYILYYLIQDYDKKIYLQIFKREKLIAKILTIEIDTTRQENAIIVVIIKYLLREEDEKTIDFMLEKDLINHLLKVFRTADKNEDFKELVMQALNNLSSGSSEHILAILQTDFYEIIFESLFSSNKNIQFNSLAIINNCISHFNFRIATKLIENGLIEKLFKLVDASERNFEKILQLIEIFDSIIELGNYELSDENDSLLITKKNNSYLESFIKMGGIEKLDELQKIPNEKINNKTVEFIEKYFNTDDA